MPRAHVRCKRLTHSLSLTLSLSLSLSLSHAHTHAHAHTHTHTHTHDTHTHTHTHTHTLSLAYTLSSRTPHTHTLSLSLTHTHSHTYSLSFTVLHLFLLLHFTTGQTIKIIAGTVRLTDCRFCFRFICLSVKYRKLPVNATLDLLINTRCSLDVYLLFIVLCAAESTLCTHCPLSRLSRRGELVRVIMCDDH